MTEINGTPVADVRPAPPRNAVAIVQVPIDLPHGHEVFEIKLRAPGIVRACGLWLHEPQVIASAMRGVKKIAMPLLLVECSPAGEINQVPRVFAFVNSDRVFVPRPGWEARYIATAFGELGAKHLLELVEVA